MMDKIQKPVIVGMALYHIYSVFHLLEYITWKPVES
jgi:hypothetical protein